jgi:hypothetical protein
MMHAFLLGAAPESVIWAPGIFGDEAEQKAQGFFLRPLRNDEVDWTSPVMRTLSEASQIHARGSPTGLYCLDALRIPELVDRAMELLSARRIRIVTPEYIYDIPRVYKARALGLLRAIEEFYTWDTPQAV